MMPTFIADASKQWHRTKTLSSVTEETPLTHKKNCFSKNNEQERLFLKKN